MDRRRYLGACACLAGSLAGCAVRRDGSGSDGDRESGTDPGTAGDAADGRATGAGGATADGLPVPMSELARGAPKDAIPAIVDPAFGDDWTGGTVGTELATDPLIEDDRVIGVVRGGDARAYPLRVLNYHEIVNDAFGGPLLVTYCPLCGSAVTAARRADGAVARFGVSGLLYRQDLVMYDEATGSLWSQIEARAIRGELTGERLSLVPSTLTTWGAWRAARPETRVLLPPPASDTLAEDGVREYDRNPYAFYGGSAEIGIGGTYEGPLHPKTPVIGIAHDGVARAYPIDRVREAGVVNDEVGGLPVVVAAARDTLVAYVRRIGGEVVAFERDGRHLRGAGSRWTVVEGRAVDGPHEGARLRRANDASPMFYFAWQKFNPDTDVRGTPDDG